MTNTQTCYFCFSFGVKELIKLEDEQDEQLQMHIASMINLFVLACGIPGLIRLVKKLSLISNSLRATIIHP